MMEALKTPWAMDNRTLETSRLVEASRLVEDPGLVEAGTLEPRRPVEAGLMKAWESLRVEVLLPMHSCRANYSCNTKRLELVPWFRIRSYKRLYNP